MTNKNKNISNKLFPHRLSVPVQTGMFHLGSSHAKTQTVNDVLIWLLENVGPTINVRDRHDKESRYLKPIKIPHDKKYSEEPTFKYKVNSSRSSIRVYFVNEFDKTHFAMTFGV